MNALVTGSAGFIGYHLTVKLLQNGWEVTGLDNMDPYYDVRIKEENLKKLKEFSNFLFVKDDINKINGIDVIKSGSFDILFHMAAKAGVRESFDNPGEYVYTNVNGTINVLDFARTNDINKFVFASSSSVYGNQSKIPFNEDETNLKPISPYALSKLNAENFCRMYSHTYDLEINALRFFTVYGPCQRPGMAICKFIRQIIEGEEIQVFGDGKTYRDYTYVDDIIKGVTGAMKYFKGFNIFNLGNGKPIVLNDLISSISEILDLEPEIKRLPIPPGEMKGTFADISKAEKLLDYKPETEIRTGLRKQIDWINSTR